MYNLGPSVTPCNPTRLCAPMPLTSTDLVSTTAADVAGWGEAAGWSDRQRGGDQGYVPCLQPATCGLQPATWARCDLGDGGEREAHRRRRAPATIRARGCSPGCYGLT